MMSTPGSYSREGAGRGVVNREGELYSLEGGIIQGNTLSLKSLDPWDRLVYLHSSQASENVCSTIDNLPAITSTFCIIQFWRWSHYKCPLWESVSNERTMAPCLLHLVWMCGSRICFLSCAHLLCWTSVEKWWLHPTTLQIRFEQNWQEPQKIRILKRSQDRPEESIISKMTSITHLPWKPSIEGGTSCSLDFFLFKVMTCRHEHTHARTERWESESEKESERERAFERGRGQHRFSFCLTQYTNLYSRTT